MHFTCRRGVGDGGRLSMSFTRLHCTLESAMTDTRRHMHAPLWHAGLLYTAQVSHIHCNSHLIQTQADVTTFAYTWRSSRHRSVRNYIQREPIKSLSKTRSVASGVHPHEARNQRFFWFYVIKVPFTLPSGVPFTASMQ